jgi:hypothetical protein
LASANNGNWHTARRWARCLASQARVRIEREWSGADDDMMIALHARRSATSIARFAAVYPQRSLTLVLTGTDLYRDIRTDEQAQRSLALAGCLVVLQAEGLRELPAEYATKAMVIYQSARSLLPGRHSSRYFDLALVGHQRPEKDPLTAVRALLRLAPELPLRLFHIGAALDTRLAAEVASLADGDRRYHWLGPLSQAATRQRLKCCRPPSANIEAAAAAARSRPDSWATPRSCAVRAALCREGAQGGCAGRHRDQRRCKVAPGLLYRLNDETAGA